LLLFDIVNKITKELAVFKKILFLALMAHQSVGMAATVGCHQTTYQCDLKVWRTLSDYQDNTSLLVFETQLTSSANFVSIPTKAWKIESGQSKDQTIIQSSLNGIGIDFTRGLPYLYRTANKVSTVAPIQNRYNAKGVAKLSPQAALIQIESDSTNYVEDSLRIDASCRLTADKKLKQSECVYD
jgi:hypothetical protein